MTIAQLSTQPNSVTRPDTFNTDSDTYHAELPTLITQINADISGIASLVAGFPLAAAAGTVDAITADFSPNITLSDKQLCAVVCAGANTSTTPTFAPDGLTAHTITMNGGQALAAGSIPAAGFVAMFEYNLANTRWELMNPKSTSSAPTAAQGASRVLLSVDSTSGGGTLDTTATFDSTYDKYELELVNLRPATDNTNLRCQMYIGGALDTGSNYYWHYDKSDGSAATYSGANGVGTQLLLTTGVSNLAAYPSRLTINFAMPAQTAQNKIIDWFGSTVSGAGNLAKASGVGANLGAVGALTGFRFSMSSGNITNLVIRTYGIKNS